MWQAIPVVKIVRRVSKTDVKFPEKSLEVIIMADDVIVRGVKEGRLDDEKEGAKREKERVREKQRE